jgi:hypothetical protein
VRGEEGQVSELLRQNKEAAAKYPWIKFPENVRALIQFE